MRDHHDKPDPATALPRPRKRKATKRRGRGEGSIEQLKSGKFRAVLSAGIDPTTKKRRKMTCTADTKREVQDWLGERRRELRQGTLADPGKLTVGGWLDQWELLKAPKVEPKTWDTHRRRLPLIRKHLGHVPLARLSTLDVERFLGALARDGSSAYGCARTLVTLKAALLDAVRLRLLAVSPAAGVRGPKHTPKEMVCYDADQARKFLTAAARHRLQAFWRLALDSGARPGELAALHWPDADLDGGSVFVRQSLECIGRKFRLKPPKTARGRRRVPIAPATVQALRWHRQWMKEEGRDVETGPVFVSRNGNWLDPANLRSACHVLAKRAGVPPCRVYDLRHTCATLLLSRDVNIKVVSQRLGHESIEMTLRFYAHVLPDMQQKAVEAVQALFGVDCPTVVPPDRLRRA